MKITHETRIKAPMETVWSVLMDFSKYPEWNPLIPLVDGVAEPGAVLQAIINPPSFNQRRTAIEITGYVSPKYFSFETHHKYGDWFYHEEFIFRMKEFEGGVNFIAEVYVTGLSLRFRRSKVENAFRLSLFNVVQSLKERIER